MSLYTDVYEFMSVRLNVLENLFKAIYKLLTI